MKQFMTKRPSFSRLFVAGIACALLLNGCAPMGNVSMPREVRDNLSRIGLLVRQSKPSVQGPLMVASTGYDASGRLGTTAKPAGPVGTEQGYAQAKSHLESALAATGVDEKLARELVSGTMVGRAAGRGAEIIVLDEHAMSILTDTRLSSQETLKQIGALTTPPLDAVLIVDIKHFVEASAGALFDCAGTYCGFSTVTGTLFLTGTGKGVYRSILVFDEKTADASLVDHYRTKYRPFLEQSAHSLRKEVLGAD